MNGTTDPAVLKRQEPASKERPDGSRDLTGTRKMAQFQSFNHNENPAAQDRILLEMGMKYAIGRDCEIDVIEAHKWLNIAAIRGNQKAERMRNQVAATMSKSELAAALRCAREWMTAH
ncbi:Hypothetical protein, conserved [Brucella ceti str. Cudo]|uniref:Sel1 repeat family protein n=16 Tax=Brucella TaxID=234 RepID=A0A0H3ASR5_BRUO2|nr:conserved hypothetical protein [Brucella ovis ATCC 25840]EEH15015.1 Hypothetical protein, conserved [Brucella ceti str. Cudo]